MLLVWCYHKRSQGGAPLNCNASNDKFARKKAIVASDSPLGLLSVREDLFFLFLFLSSPIFWDKIGPSIREDFFLLFVIV